MKKLFLFMFMMIGFVMNAQEEQTKSFEETLVPYVDKILKGIEQGVEYAADEIPIVLYQYVMYEAIMAWFYVTLGVLIFIAWLIMWKNEKEKDWYLESVSKGYPGYIMFNGIGWSMVIIVSLLLIFNNIDTAIQATFFPKLFLVEEFFNYI